MQDLKCVSQTIPVPAFRELSQLSVEAEKAQDKTREYISKLENYILQLLTRTPEKVESEISSIIGSLASISDSYILNVKITSDYGADFFKNEIDNTFKVALANALLNLLHSRFGAKFQSPLLQGIAHQELEYLDFFSSPFIKG